MFELNELETMVEIIKNDIKDRQHTYQIASEFVRAEIKEEIAELKQILKKLIKAIEIQKAGNSAYKEMLRDGNAN